MLLLTLLKSFTFFKYKFKEKGFKIRRMRLVGHQKTPPSPQKNLLLYNDDREKMLDMSKAKRFLLNHALL